MPVKKYINKNTVIGAVLTAGAICDMVSVASGGDSLLYKAQEAFRETPKFSDEPMTQAIGAAYYEGLLHAVGNAYGAFVVAPLVGLLGAANFAVGIDPNESYKGPIDSLNDSLESSKYDYTSLI